MENTLVGIPENRPANIERILNSLERYGAENITLLQDYVTKQASEGFIDSPANLALLKLYQFNTHLSRDDVILTILSKALIRFYSCDFTSCLHLLHPSVLLIQDPPAESLSDQTQKLFHLYSLLDSAKYSEFWNTFESDDAYADIVADVNGFEDELRLSIAKTVEISLKQIAVPVFQEWSNLSENKFTKWVEETLGWKISGTSVIVPVNKDNEIKMVVTNETVRFEQLNKIIKKVYELKA